MTADKPCQEEKGTIRQEVRIDNQKRLRIEGISIRFPHSVEIDLADKSVLSLSRCLRAKNSRRRRRGQFQTEVLKVTAEEKE